MHIKYEHIYKYKHTHIYINSHICICTHTHRDTDQSCATSHPRILGTSRIVEVHVTLLGGSLLPDRELALPSAAAYVLSRRLWKSKALREKEALLCRSTYGRGPNASEGSRDVLTSLRHQNQTVFDVLAFQTLGECLYFVFSYQVHMNLL